MSVRPRLPPLRVVRVCKIPKILGKQTQCMPSGKRKQASGLATFPPPSPSKTTRKKTSPHK